MQNDDERAHTWIDPYLHRAEEHGCNNCGRKLRAFYAMEFYVLPARMRRKRHREREQTAIFCGECVDSADTFRVRIDDRELNFSPATPADSPGPCDGCGGPIQHRQLYGLVSLSHFIEGSCMDFSPLATFCCRCVEEYKISLPAKL